MLSLNFEYRVIPAPRRAGRARGVSSEERFAQSLASVMNDMGREGWEYVRADTLPMDERAGLTGGTKTSFLNMLVFRRVIVRGAQMLAVGEDQDQLPPMTFDARTPQPMHLPLPLLPLAAAE